ncbi:MAG: EFR1 family ferrodoxin [bacterium]|nr:EFR1 family ferrodoxin [bacterium]MDD5354435.1 EFR1 family ferrodoxin [bacterium]MDD5756085.1 EFR1 family ferrodoxin [bacterium]
MKTLLYYFTGTGNTLKIAKDLAAQLGDTEIIPIAKVIDQPSITPSADRVGIVFPVYIWGPPLIVANFARKLQVPAATYVFGITNYGGFPAGTLLMLKDLLATNKIDLSAGFGIKMPGNYTPMYGAKSTAEQQKHFAREAAAIKEIAEIVKANKSVPISANNALVNSLFSSFIYKHGSLKIPEGDKAFWVDEKCNSCGVCEKVCPVKNIKMSDGKPVWLHHCEQCVGCLQWCPQEAIQAGKKTAVRKRYHHPDITEQDMISQQKN